jgi:hypothetical protein
MYLNRCFKIKKKKVEVMVLLGESLCICANTGLSVYIVVPTHCRIIYCCTVVRCIEVT